MTEARKIEAGTTYLITRRSLRRHFLFRPDRRMRRLFTYVLAVCAERHGVQVHGAVLMSNHEHLVVTDVRGVLPDFLRDLHRLVALGTKTLRGWEGAAWDGRPTGCVELVTAEAVVEKLAYAIANPVAAGLVRFAREWPGVTLRAVDVGRRVYRARRPDWFFDAENADWPEEVDLGLTMPPALAGMEPGRVRALIADEVAAQEREAQRRVAERGGRFLGARRASRVSPEARASRQDETRGMNPRVAAGRGQSQVRFEALARLWAFRVAYRAALARWRAGEREVCFPAGTWLMRCVHGARIGPAPGGGALLG